MSVRPKKRLGQHFLTDDGVVRRIVDAVAAPAGARVVEIGPGEGALTGALLARYPDLVALEVDPEAVGHLRARFPKLDVRQGDVLAADWRALATEGNGEWETGTGADGAPATAASGAGERGQARLRSASSEARRPTPAEATASAAEQGAGDDPGPHAPTPPTLYVVGNLPYYITSPILFALLDARQSVARAVVMVQKEVADRLAAPPGSKAYGTLSVYFSLYARASLLVDVPRQAFRPVPAVESAVVVVDFEAARAPDVPFGALQRTVRAAFGQRRKMLRNSLGPMAQAAGADLGVFATLRPEAVAPADFVHLATLLHVD